MSTTMFAVWFSDRKPISDRSGHSFFYEVKLPSLRAVGAVLDGTAFDLRLSPTNADNHARAYPRLPLWAFRMSAAASSPSLEIAMTPSFIGRIGRYFRRASEHFFRISADSFHCS